MPGLPCPCRPCQPGWQICPHASLSQAWHGFLLLAGRDDSLNKHCNSSFLNENLCFVPIQICWETGKSLCWLWPRCTGLQNRDSHKLTSHPFQARQEHRVHPRDAKGTSPASHHKRCSISPQHCWLSAALPCFGSSSSCRPAALAEHREEKEIAAPHCKLAAGQRNSTPWDCNDILLAQASWEASPLPANYRT